MALPQLRDLADVLEFVRAARLPEELVAELDPSVREYQEFWRTAQGADPE